MFTTTVNVEFLPFRESESNDMIEYQPVVAELIQRIEHNLKSSDTFRNLVTRRHSIEESLTRYNVPGLSIAVINDGQLEWAKGYGVREAGKSEPVTTETLFQCASISKPVAAIGAMRLVETGKLSLDEDVNEQLTSWKVPPVEFQDGSGHAGQWQPHITLRQLVSHTAGLTVDGFPGYTFDQRIPSYTDILDGKLPANTPAIRVDTLPGTQFRYSGGGYCVLLHLLEDVTGKPFPALLRELVLEPFGMAHSTYEQPLPNLYAVHAASAHRSGAQVIPGKYHIYPEIAPDGLWTTPSDLAQFVLTLQRAFTGQDNTLISREMMQQVFTPQAPASMGATIGLGVFLYGSGETARFGHDGGNEGFLSRLLAYQQRGQGAIVMGNADECWPVLQEMLDAIAEAYQWPDYAPAKPTPVAIDSAQLDVYVGTYKAKIGQQFIVTRQDDSLYLTYNFHAQQPPIQLFPLSATHFYMEAVNAEVTFKRDRTAHLNFKQNRQEIVAKKI